MRSNPRYHLAAACLVTTAGLFVALAPVSAADDARSSDKDLMAGTPKPLALPDGITPKDLNDQKAIEKSFSGITEDAISKNDFSGVVSYLVEQDKDRIKKSTDKSLNNLDGQKNKQLNDVVASLQNNWKSKYNQSFSIDYKKAYADTHTFQILTGVVNNPDLLVGKWPVAWYGSEYPIRGMNGMMNNRTTGGEMSAADAQTAKDKYFGGDVKLEVNREVAIARFEGVQHAMPITASLIHETASGWHFDIPNTLDSQRLYDRLVANLNHLNSMQNSWPSDANQAGLTFTHAVIAALYDMDTSNMGNRSASAQ